MGELKNLEVNVGQERLARLRVENEHFLIVEFRDCQKGIAPMTINTPDLIVKALHEFKKANANFRVKTLVYLGVDFAVYYLERIL